MTAVHSGIVDASSPFRGGHACCCATGPACGRPTECDHARLRGVADAVVDACLAGGARLARDVVSDLGSGEVGEPGLVSRLWHVDIVHRVPRLQRRPLALVLIRVLAALVGTQLPRGLHGHLLPVYVFEAPLVRVGIMLG